jgi:hypothetical protein
VLELALAAFDAALLFVQAWPPEPLFYFLSRFGLKVFHAKYTLTDYGVALAPPVCSHLITS